MPAKVLPFRRPPSAAESRVVVPIGSVVALEGYVVLPRPSGSDGDPEVLTPEGAVTLAHALLTCAATAEAQRADEKRGRRG